MIMIFGIPGPLLFGQLLLGLINGAFYAMLSLGLAVIFGMLNIINFAHGSLFMMGAFASWMLLNYVGIGQETLDFVADRNTHKQGRYIPGVRLPISSPERVLAEQPDYVLILPWNFKDEIMAQQAEYRRRGGKFIVPVPRPTII